jgi:hypothetical protein
MSGRSRHAVALDDPAGSVRLQEPTPGPRGFGVPRVFDRRYRIEVFRVPSAEGYREVRQYGLGERRRPSLLPDIEVDLSME